MALAVLVTGKAMPAAAVPTSLTINGSATSISLPVGPVPAVVLANYTDEPNGSSMVLTSSAPAVAAWSFTATVTQNLDGQTVTQLPATVTVTDDADAAAEATQVQAFIVCLTAGTSNLSMTQGGATIPVAPTTLTVTCGTGTTTITFSNAAPTIGVAITVTAQCTGAAQPLTASPVGNGAFGATGITNGTWVSASQVNCNGAVPMTVPYTCALAGAVTFTLNAVTNVLTCTGTTTGGLTLSATTGMTGTVTGTCPAAGSVLTQTGPAAFTSATLNGSAITVAAGSITCTAAGTIVANFVCNTVGTIFFALGSATATFYCNSATYNPCGTTYLYQPGYNCGNFCGAYATQYAYNCGVCDPAYQYAANCANNCGAYGTQYAYNCINQYPQNILTTPASLTVSTSPTVACGQTSQVTVRVVGSNGGNVPDGTAVALAASVGTLSPASASTSGGTVTATYTAPAAVPATSVTLRATAGSASNTTGLQITCTQTTTTAPSTAPAPPPVSVPVSIPVIAPPNTGDAGLLVLKDDVCED